MNGRFTGMIHAEGERLVDGSGREVLLRGVGLGSWLLPEGYMWRLPEQGDRPRRIEQMIAQLVGPERAEAFWRKYRDQFISRGDIRRIAEEGFNSVRLPLNWRFLVGHLANGETDADPDVSAIKGPAISEEAFALIDRLLSWCREEGLSVILDLHGAPGGQTGTNIDDSRADSPELFRNSEYRKLTIQLWREMAQRYRDEPVVAAYDLLNEPLPEWFSEHNSMLMEIYEEISKAIRAVGDDHLIMLEGVHWATDWSVFTEKLDSNTALQFHKYWNRPDSESIRSYLDIREQLRVPIIMGESGENNTEWYAGAFRLFEDHAISWNFWTWKKMDTINSPCSIRPPRNWARLVDYLGTGARATKPTETEAADILSEFLDNVRFETCVYHREVVDAILRRPPVTIPAAFYGFAKSPPGFCVTNPVKPSTDYRVSDGTDIHYPAREQTSTRFDHNDGREWNADEWLSITLRHEDWVAYDFWIPEGIEDVNYSVELCLGAAEGDASIAVSIDDQLVDELRIPFPIWHTISLDLPFLGDGTHRVSVRSMGGATDLRWLRIFPR